jgi:hypothetical protein
LSRGVNTNRDRSDACLMKRVQVLLNAPQLGVAENSPIAAIED